MNPTDLAASLARMGSQLSDISKLLALYAPQIGALLPAADAPVASPPPTKPVDPPTPIDLPPTTNPPPPSAPAPIDPPGPVSVDPSTPVVLGPSFTRDEYEAFVKLHPGFRTSAFDPAMLAALPSSYPDGVPGEMTYEEPAPAYRPEIGIRTNAASLWAITQHPQARLNLLANADSSKWFPIHLCPPETPGEPLRPWLYPHKASASTTNDTGMIGDAVGNPAIHVDVAHQPHFLLEATLLMFAEGNTAKFNEYLREMKFWVAYNYYHSTDNARGYAKGIFNPFGGVYQPRGTAWAMVWLFGLTLVLTRCKPDDEWLPWCLSCIEENILFYDGVFRVGDYDLTGFSYYAWQKQAYQNDFGIMQAGSDAYGLTPDGAQTMSGFMMAFQAQVWLWGYLLKLPLRAEAQAKFDVFIRWAGKFPVMMFGKPDDAGSWDYRRAGEYAMAVGVPRTDFTGTIFFKTPGDFYRANYKTFPALPLDDHSFREHDTNAEMEEFGGRYVDNIVPALSFAVEIGIEGATEAFARAKSTRQWKTMGGSLAFGYLPSGEYFDQGTYVVLSAASPAPAPAAPSPSPLTDILANATKLAADGDVWSLSKTTTLLYGARLPIDVVNAAGKTVAAGDYFIKGNFPAGEYHGNLVDYGIADPCIGIHKDIFAIADDATVPLIAPASTAAPAKSPATSPAGTPVPVAPAPATVPQTNAVPTIAGVGAAFFAAARVSAKRRWYAMGDADIVRTALETFKGPVYGDLRAMMTAWSGAGFEGSVMAGAGGGHFDCSFNGVWAFDWMTGKATLPVTPSVVSQADLDAVKASWNTPQYGGWLGYTNYGIAPSGSAADGKPGAVHTYNAPFMDAGRLIIADRVYDLAAGTVSYFNCKGAPNTSGAAWGRKWIITGMLGQYWDISVIDPVAMTVNTFYMQFPDYKPGQAAALSYGPDNYVAIIGDMLHTLKTTGDAGDYVPPLSWDIDLAAGTGNCINTCSSLSGKWSADDMARLQRGTQVLNPETGTVYIPSKDWGTWFTWKPKTGELGKFDVEGARPIQQPNGAYGRLRWFEGMIILLNSIDEKPYVILPE